MDNTNAQKLSILIERETRESTAAPQMATLEALMIEVLKQLNPPPRCRSVKMSATCVEWAKDSPSGHLTQGSTGTLSLWPDPTLPYPVIFDAQLISTRIQSGKQKIQAELLNRSERVIDLYEQLVFIYYRRDVAEHR